VTLRLSLILPSPTHGFQEWRGAAEYGLRGRFTRATGPRSRHIDLPAAAWSRPDRDATQSREFPRP